MEDTSASAAVRYDNNNKDGAIPGTVEVYEHIAELVLDVTRYDNNNKDGAIPGTVDAYHQIAEVTSMTSDASRYDNNNKDGAIPGTVEVYDQIAEVVSDLARYDNNNKDGAIPGTVEVYEKIAEVDRSLGNQKAPGEVGVIRLRGESPCPSVLTQPQCESYLKDGYLVLPGAISANQASNLVNEAQELIKRIYEGGEGITKHDISGTGAEIPSAVGRILATFELGDKTASNPFERRIARLGCGVHKIPSFRALTKSSFNRSIAASLGYSDPRLTQSQLIAKLAGIGGQIVPHQDGCVSFTDPSSALTFWYALEDTTLENGCLCVAPGSHLTEPLRQRLIRGEDGRPTFVNVKTPVWAKGANGGEIKDREVENEFLPLEVKKGSLVLFHGNLMHKSGINQSEKNRMAYTFSIVDGSEHCPEDSCMLPADGSYERL